MLPRPTDNGARLAALLPTAIASLALGAGADARQVLAEALGAAASEVPEQLPACRSFILVVVDGLGHANLKSAAGHARTLSGLQSKRIETVIPSTTGAALTTITTGRLPGQHGLIGYKIMHPELGLVTTLKGWDGIADPHSWQRCAPLFGLAAGIGVAPYAIGRPAHATGGLTEAILAGAEYVGGQTIDDRFASASRLVRGGDPVLAYVYVDELDKVAHSDGWQSEKWIQRLEQLDAALDDLLRTLPSDIGVIVTADHGVIDVPREKRIMLDGDVVPMDGVAEIGGEPRLRSLYLERGRDAIGYAEKLQSALGKLAWVGTRDEAIGAGWFGEVAHEVAPRLGDVLVVPRGQTAFTLSSDSQSALDLVGQHGGVSDEERGIPLILAGSLHGSGFASALAANSKR